METAATTPTSSEPLAAADPSPTVEPLPQLEPAQSAPSPVADASNDDLLPIAAAGAAGMLALAGAGMAMRRRRRTIQEDVIVNEPRIARSVTSEPEPAPRNSPIAATAVPAMAAGGNRIEQALRGPTPDNPFLSLKKRLKRAAFFEQRERQVRQGIGAHVSPMAGLPRQLAENFSARMQPKPMQRFRWA